MCLPPCTFKMRKKLKCCYEALIGCVPYIVERAIFYGYCGYELAALNPCGGRVTFSYYTSIFFHTFGSSLLSFSFFISYYDATFNW